MFRTVKIASSQSLVIHSVFIAENNYIYILQSLQSSAAAIKSTFSTVSIFFSSFAQSGRHYLYQF